ncbi:hypothetical protein Taro_028319 [Colocasia esculenta]|uniref:ENTH domain-containing protein n=1 Tax=Colocasia esculenta TaxID=4460 RepID=A0A843VI80_COLES|nr:hypothetical protein [Colocasia esculenta]
MHRIFGCRGRLSVSDPIRSCCSLMSLSSGFEQLKREVNKKVLKVPRIEQKILDATSNEPWGPHGSLLADIAQATRNYHEYQIIMTMIWKRINDTGKNWRHVYKGLTVLEYLVAHGSERVIDEIREHAHQIATLSDFQYIDSSGRDQGSNVRKKSQSLVALVNDKERIQEVRQKAHANRDKYRSTFSTGGMTRPASYSGSGSYGDHFDDDHYHGNYGNREDDRNGYGRDRDWGYRDDDRYGKGGDSYGRDGDRYNRDSDERYNRDGFRNDDYRGSGGTDDYQFGSRNRSIDRDKDRPFDEDDRYSSRSGGGRIDESSHNDRSIERKFSEGSLSAPPSYEEVVVEPQHRVQDERDRPAVQAHIPKVPLAPKTLSLPPNLTPAVASAAVSQSPKEAEAFDEFDPRGSAAAATYTGASSGTDNFGFSDIDPINALALVPVTASTASEAHMVNDSDFGASFSSTSYPFNQPAEDPFGDSPFKAIPQDNNTSVQQQNFAPVTSVALSAVSISNSAAQPPEIPKTQPITSFNNGDSFHATAPVMNGHASATTFGVLPPELTVLQPSTGALEDLHSHIGVASVAPSQPFQPMPVENVQPTTSNFLSQSGPSAPQMYPQSFLYQTALSAPPLAVPQASPYPFSQQGMAAAAPVPHSLPLNHLSQLGQPTPLSTQAGPSVLSQSGFSAAVGPQSTSPSMLSQPGLPSTGTSQLGQAATGLPAKSAQPNDKFETKSTVWADTLSRGLVNLNISGPKINPLADIGIDFDSINRMEKRKERERSTAAPVSTVSMGKAMGSGSGIGRAGAMGLAAPPNPMMGSGMGMGTAMGNPGSMGMGMGMAGMGGYGAGMNQQPIGMGMGGMNMGMGQGAAMRPPTGMPSGPAMPGMGYNPMMGMGGYGSQQFGGYR